jgi:hypothetical protein
MYTVINVISTVCNDMGYDSSCDAEQSTGHNEDRADFTCTVRAFTRHVDYFWMARYMG